MKTALSNSNNPSLQLKGTVYDSDDENSIFQIKENKRKGLEKSKPAK